MLIGEVAAKSGVSARMLRHYDAMGLVSPTERTSGGYRHYSPADVRRLFHVEGLRSLGLGLHDIAAVLDGAASDPSAVVTELIEHTRARIARETDLLRRLEQVQAASPGAWADVLHTIRLLRGLDADDPSARQRLALSLGFDATGDVATLVEAALSERDTNAAGALDWALARFGDEAVPALCGALESASADRRRRAVEALTKIDTAAAQRALSSALDHPDEFVSGRAALVLGKRAEPAAVPALLALVVRGQDDVEAADVLAALATRLAIGDRITTAVLDALADAGTGGAGNAGGDEGARVRLTEALGGIPDSAARAALTELSRDRNRQVAVTAIALLRSRGDDGMTEDGRETKKPADRNGAAG
ncbi:MerR family transcriptional regulator [Cumulibacter manganitolerans]|uniref:MerR family transcriptional regulator n=1 Tax=Cumulibacter manganitolerans TaxID=1884992 RepID=UPI001297DDCE|nr:MerR family transcriptional regulator [Cumulibacter manganitolerans]